MKFVADYLFVSLAGECPSSWTFAIDPDFARVSALSLLSMWRTLSLSSILGKSEVWSTNSLRIYWQLYCKLIGVYEVAVV